MKINSTEGFEKYKGFAHSHCHKSSGHTHIYTGLFKLYYYEQILKPNCILGCLSSLMYTFIKC